MKVWNIEVTDRNGSDGYSFIQNHEPTEEQLDFIKKTYENSGRYLKEELDDIYVEIINSFDNSKIPTWDQLKEYLKEKYKNKKEEK
tara:strand:+ start:72 stop:329 length:258 start_codon:yes stop_codon:yes gene_type:complete